LALVAIMCNDLKSAQAQREGLERRRPGLIACCNSKLLTRTDEGPRGEFPRGNLTGDSLGLH
jgi:hypothetical protein